MRGLMRVGSGLIVLVCFGVVVLAGASPSDAGGHVPGHSPARIDTPVLLVPGWFDTDRDLAAMRIRLVAAGWAADHVAALRFADPTGSNRMHAEEIDSAAKALLEATDHTELDIVAHSMGGLATRWFMRSRQAAPVRRVIFLATPHRGTYSAYVAWGDGSREMKPGSAFLEELNAAPAVPIGVQAMTVRTPVDTHVLPGESATLPGVPDEAVCCPTHAGLLRNMDVFRIIRRFLDQGPT